MDNVLDKKLNQSYQAGFTTNVESETLPPGLNEDTVRKISKIKNEPEWLLNFRLKAYNRWKVLKKPDWANLQIEPIDYQSISYYSAPKKGPASYDEVDPEIKKDFEMAKSYYKKAIEIDNNYTPSLDALNSLF